jgi:arabinosaccharide transport system substrate-binding protein
LGQSIIERFPFGKAPFWLLVLAVASTLTQFVLGTSEAKRPDLLLVTFAQAHYDAYQPVVERFEREHHVSVAVEVAHWSSLQSRLQNAMLAGADVPDILETLENSVGFFTSGPRSDTGIVDFTELFRKEGIDRRVLASRLSLWTARGRNYGIPHDVHPVMLAYRRDLVEQLGIDVEQLDTWDKFVQVGRRITQDTNGDGVIDRYMLDLPASGNWALELLLLQRGGGLFDASGNVSMDSQEAVQVIDWYVHQVQGPHRIANDCGWTQPLLKAMSDGLVLFYLTPDWRSRVFELDAPSLTGKMALMPLPAWHPGGRRTSVWGGTGLIITKRNKHLDQAWELAKLLYFDSSALGQRFRTTNIVAPFKEAWDLPELRTPNPYYSNQPIGKLYATLAPDTPAKYTSAVAPVAFAAINQTLSRAALYFQTHGDDGLLDYIRRELKSSADRVRSRAARYAVLQSGAEP